MQAREGKSDMSDVLGYVTEATGTPPIEWGQPDGLHRVELVKVSMIKQTFDPKQGPKDRLQWEFVPCGYQGEGTLKFWTSFSKHQRSKLPAVYAAFGLDMPSAGQPVQGGLFLGRTCQALIKRMPGKKDPSKRYPTIIDLLPDATSTGSAPQAPASPPEGDIPF
jgi:hypothetical protein